MKWKKLTAPKIATIDDYIVEQTTELFLRLQRNAGFALQFMKILPPNYEVTVKENGIHCYSRIGMEDKQWDSFLFDVKFILGRLFLEAFHQQCHKHKEFTIFIRSDPNEKRCNRIKKFDTCPDTPKHMACHDCASWF